jgi:nicotinamidase-related amidase
MPAKNVDLHGSAPDKSPLALLLIDVINDFDFPEADELIKHAQTMAERLAALKLRAKENGVPVVYVNDNFGRWRSDFEAQVSHCLTDDNPGKSVVDLLKPEPDDYFVLKPKHSGFFSTTLDTLLEYLGVNTVIITGIATNICVLFTANDAYMRDFHLLVPADCTASNTREQNEYALQQIKEVLKADTGDSAALDFSELLKRFSQPNAER